MTKLASCPGEGVDQLHVYIWVRSVPCRGETARSLPFELIAIPGSVVVAVRLGRYCSYTSPEWDDDNHSLRRWAIVVPVSDLASAIVPPLVLVERVARHILWFSTGMFGQCWLLHTIRSAFAAHSKAETPNGRSVMYGSPPREEDKRPGCAPGASRHRLIG